MLKRIAPLLFAYLRPNFTAGSACTVVISANACQAISMFPPAVMVPFGIQTPNSFVPATTLVRGIPPIAAPDLDNGVLDIPLNVGFQGMPKNLHRGYIQSGTQPAGINIVGQPK